MQDSFVNKQNSTWFYNFERFLACGAKIRSVPQCFLTAKSCTRGPPTTLRKKKKFSASPRRENLKKSFSPRVCATRKTNLGINLIPSREALVSEKTNDSLRKEIKTVFWELSQKQSQRSRRTHQHFLPRTLAQQWDLRPPNFKLGIYSLFNYK